MALPIEYSPAQQTSERRKANNATFPLPGSLSQECSSRDGNNDGGNSNWDRGRERDINKVEKRSGATAFKKNSSRWSNEAAEMAITASRVTKWL